MMSRHTLRKRGSAPGIPQNAKYFDLNESETVIQMLVKMMREVGVTRNEVTRIVFTDARGNELAFCNQLEQAPVTMRQAITKQHELNRCGEQMLIQFETEEQ